jgi:hypothetical protein
MGATASVGGNGRARKTGNLAVENTALMDEQVRASNLAAVLS